MAKLLRKPTIASLVAWGKAATAMSLSTQRMPINQVWMDSRKVGKNDVFVALETEHDDGHKYIGMALKAGAVAAIVEKRKLAELKNVDAKKLVVVDNTLRAVQRMGAAYRKELGVPFIAITGSSGKTTTRTFINAVLGAHMPVGSTFTNWNNHIGVPLSILRFSGKEKAGILELGANHQHEIDGLSQIVKPDYGVITNIGYAHLGLFGSLKATTEAKFEIIEGMNKQKGILLLNGDDARLYKGASDCAMKKISFFGMSKRCTVRATHIDISTVQSRFTLDHQIYCLPMAGLHFVYSALPAIWLGREFGVPEKTIADALASLTPAPMRGTIEQRNGMHIIADCYNANPSSMVHAINQLKKVSEKNGAVAVVGDMLELGRFSAAMHRSLGRRLASAGVRRILAVGQFAQYIAEGALAAGYKRTAMQCVPNADAAKQVVLSLVKKGDTVLLKGSRGVHLESLLEVL
jgi:UDP-N-acetylmuramoyl-tripeptide--D-alanyl-D-alanine ligase